MAKFLFDRRLLLECSFSVWNDLISLLGYISYISKNSSGKVSARRFYFSNEQCSSIYLYFSSQQRHQYINLLDSIKYQLTGPFVFPFLHFQRNVCRKNFCAVAVVINFYKPTAVYKLNFSFHFTRKRKIHNTLHILSMLFLSIEQRNCVRMLAKICMTVIQL